MYKALALNRRTTTTHTLNTAQIGKYKKYSTSLCSSNTTKPYILDIITSINSRRDMDRDKIVLETKLGLGDRETASVDLS